MPMVHPKILVAQGLQRRASSDTLMLHQIGSEPYPPQSREEFSQPTTGRDREICCRSDAQALPNTVIPCPCVLLNQKRCFQVFGVRFPDRILNKVGIEARSLPFSLQQRYSNAHLQRLI